MDKFTPEFIQHQREIAEKATPRPWAFYDAYNVSGKPGIVGANRLGTDDVTVIEASPYGYNEINVIEADAEYLHTSANNYPDALAEIERLRRLLGMKDDALSSYAEFYGRAASLCGLPEDALPGSETDAIILQRLAEHDEIARLREAQRWIPVGERMPEFELGTASKYVEVAYRIPGSPNYLRGDVQYWEKYGWVFKWENGKAETFDDYGYIVEFWKPPFPLPQPPQEA